MLLWFLKIIIPHELHPQFSTFAETNALVSKKSKKAEGEK